MEGRNPGRIYRCKSNPTVVEPAEVVLLAIAGHKLKKTEAVYLENSRLATRIIAILFFHSS